MAELNATTTLGNIQGAVITDLYYDGSYNYCIATGTGNNYEGSFTPAITALTPGLTLRFKAHHANTGAVTFNPDGLGAIPVRKEGNVDDLSAGEIVNGQIVTVVYDGTYFQVLLLLITAVTTVTSVGSSYEIDAVSYSGSTNRATIVLALNAIGTVTKCTLLLCPGIWIIDDDLDMSAYSNISIHMPVGAMMQIASGKTVTFSGPFEAGLYQVFSCVGTGAVSFGSGSIAVYHPAWFNNTTQPPVANTFPVGVITFDLSPTAGSPIGWVCIVAGTPGTWSTSGGVTDATETIHGVTVYAGNTKALAGTDTESAVTPNDLKYVIDNGITIPNATGTTPGLTVYAGNAKALTGTDTASAVTPNDLKYAISNGIIPAASISQSKLKTSIGSVSVTVGAGLAAVTAALPGGEYGFTPQVKSGNGNIAFRGFATYSNVYTSYVTPGAQFQSGTDSDTGYVQQRYVTSSGEVFWIFILRDKITKEVIATYQAPDHPCFGNGGKPSLMSHPFGNYDPLIHEVIVINPSEKEVEAMRNACIMPENKPDRDMIEVILEDYEIDEDSKPDWPTTPVTVGLDNNQDWKRAQDGTPVTTIKKVIEKPSGIFAKSLKKKG